MAVISFPPLMENNEEKKRNWLHLQFSDGEITITVQTEGAGAYLTIETTETEWPINPEELMAFAQWANEICQAMDEQ